MTDYLAVVTADNHLRSRTWNKHPELQGDAYVAFTKIIDFCLHYRLPLFLLGDTFDSHSPPADAVAFLCGKMDQMAQAGLPVYYIKGNHDATDVPWPAVHRHCTHLHGRLVSIGPFQVYGMDFVSAGQLPQRLSEIPGRADIIMLHQSWREIQPIGHTDGSLSDIPLADDGQIPVVFTGDFHVHKRYDIVREDGVTLPVFSPGSTSMQKLNEEVTKYFYVLSQKDGQLRVESQLLPSRPVHTAHVRNEEDLQAVINQIQAEAAVQSELPTEIQRKILRVRFNDAIPEAYTRLIAAGADKFHFFDEPQHVTEEVVIDVAATPEGAFDSLITAIGQLASPASAQYHGVRRLLEAAEPKSELDKMYQEYLQRHAGTTENTGGVSPHVVG